MDFAQRRRVVLALAITVVGIIALAVSNRDSASGSRSAASPTPGAATIATAAPENDDAPADPAFLPSASSSVAPQIITVNVPAPPTGTVIDGRASYVRWPQTMGLRPCATPHALIGAITTVRNLDNGRQVKCNNVSIESLRDGSVIILHTEVFLELADLIDSPIPVEISF